MFVTIFQTNIDKRLIIHKENLDESYFHFGNSILRLCERLEKNNDVLYKVNTFQN